jgi:cytochrome c-type biogenesis protein CcmH/NrfF
MTVMALVLAAALQVAVPTPLAPAIEQEARQIERMLIAPCCWNQPVSEHKSQASEQVKEEIRLLLGAGKNRQQVLDDFTSRYGVRILAEPPNRGLGRLLYSTPVVVFFASGAALTAFIWKVSRKRGPNGRGAAEPAAGLPDAAADAQTLEDRLDEELRDMD